MRLRTGFGLWRRLGPAAGTVAAARMGARVTRAPLRRARLARRPLTVDPADVRAALGHRDPVAVLRGVVLAALPTVTAWERELDSLAPAARADILTRADAVAAHRFDLLGSGSTDLGPEIDWQRDFKSGRSWPLVHISRVPISYPDGSDVKVPWELSRFQHAPLLAAAARITGERRHLDELGAQLEHWIARNPVEVGANWVVTMDVAIRAANWVAALALCAEQARAEPWVDAVVGSLLLHGRFIRSHLERAPVRGNHYLADVVGLLSVAALFSGSGEGRRWARWAAGQLVAEMEHQVRPDGCDHEASTAYHRLVCELFVCGTQAVDALAPRRLPARYRARLERMLGFAAAYTAPGGLAPQVGDADDGRFLPLGDYGADPRRHDHLFRQSGQARPRAAGSVAYPDGGWYVMRAGRLHVLVRCGDTGLGGHGGHGHNDQLSFELALGSQPMVVDPGTYAYTGDPLARDLFRSTRFHAAVSVGGAEQNDLGQGLFALPDRTRAEALVWEPGKQTVTFEGRHRGFEALDPAAVHTRRLELDGEAGALSIRDTVTSSGAHELEWTFPLVPCHARSAAGRVEAEFERGRLLIEAEGLELVVEEGWYSPSYGARVRAPFVRARRPGRTGEDVTELRLTARPAPQG